jgi:hypothetical protein
MVSQIPMKKNVQTTIYFPIYDGDGDLVNSAAGLDENISKDGGSLVDCTNGASEIGSSGIYALTLTPTETNADVVILLITSTTTGAKPTAMIFYTAGQTFDDMQADIDILKQVATGRWRITGNQLIFYASDEVTPLYTFDLKDSVGSPSSTNIFERDPV